MDPVAPSESSQNEEPIKVILVEDDSDLRDLLCICLNKQGIQVSGVGSAMELYQKLAVEKADIIVLDIGLPDQDGYAIADFLRANTDAGVVMLTAHAQIHDRVKGYASGADIYFVKPVDCLELSLAIRNLKRRLEERERKTENPAPQLESPPEGATDGGGKPWSLDHSAWSIAAPNGVEVRLTTKEFNLMAALMSTPGHHMDRNHLAALLGYAPTEGGNRAGLDVLISRVRRKVEQSLGAPLPLRTVHGKGYLFSAPVRHC